MNNGATNKGGGEPSVRFPEFKSTDWDKKKLSSLLFETKQRNRALRYDSNHVLSVSGEYGCVNQIEHLGRSYAGSSVSNYHVVETGDIVYTKSPLKNAPYGIIKENKGKAGIVSTLYAVYRTTDEANSAFLDHYFSRDFNLNSYLQPIVRKGAKNDMKVNNADVLGGEVWIPGRREQTKIADFLSSLDELIDVSNQKLIALQRHKKGLTQELFPAEGEALPRRRFPGFESASEWNTSTLGAIADISSGGTPSRTKADYWGGDIPWITTTLVNFGRITTAKEFITENGLRNSSAKLFSKNTILMAMYGQGKTRGQVAILGIDAAINQACAAITLKSGMNTQFVFQYLAARYEQIRKISNSGGQENLSGELVKKIPVSYPDIDGGEQQRIADCLYSVDELITAQAKKVDALRVHKKGLMQALFPAIGEVEHG